jgi:sulfur carrier protein
MIMSPFITINGTSHPYPNCMTLDALLASLAINVMRVAIECNGVLIPKSQHPSTLIHPGDSIEIVQFIGGG